MRELLSILMLMSLLSCSDGNLDKSSGSRLKDNEQNLIVSVCSKEAETLYVLMRSDIESETSIFPWKVINPGTCTNFTDWSKIHSLKGYYIQSARGRYTPRGVEYLTLPQAQVCLQRNMSLTQGFDYKYDGFKVYNSGICPNNLVKYPTTNLGNYELTYSGDTTIQTYTFQGGKYLESERVITKSSNEGGPDLHKEIAELTAKLTDLKNAREECDKRTTALLAQGKILGTPASRFDELKSVCVFSPEEHADLKKKVEEVKNLARDTLSLLISYLKSFYDKLVIMGQRVDVIAPFQDDFSEAGVERLVRPAVDADLLARPEGFFSRTGDGFKQALANFYGQYTNKFIASGLAFTSTFASFGDELAQAENMDQDRFLDFKKSVDSIEDYFSTLDYGKDSYGYPLDSPVPDDVKKTVRDDIKPYAGASGAGLEDALKKWEGTLTEKQLLILEAIRFLGQAFHQSVLNLPDEFAQIGRRLTSITEGAIQAVKETAVCAAKVGSAGDFGDWYEIVNRRDICTGEEISRAGQVISAAGLVVGSAKFWRVMGEVAGIAVHSKIVFKETERLVESTTSIIRHNPINPGVLHSKSLKDLIILDSRGVPIANSTVADTFRSATYLTVETKETTKLYRAFSDPKREMGAYWSRIRPTGPKQAVMDSALDPTWGNQATKWVEINVPAGIIIHEGIAAPVSNIPAGIELIGGGSQVYIDQVIPTSWIDPLGGGAF